MAGEFGSEVRRRLGVWRAQLWQIFEAQYEPFSLSALQRYLRSILATAHLAGFDKVVESLDAMSRRLTLPDPPAQEEFEEALQAIMAEIDALAEDLPDQPMIVAQVIHIAPGQNFLLSPLDISLVFQELSQLGHLEAMPDIDACPVWEQFDPARCTMRWDLILLSNQNLERIHDALDFLGSEPNMQIEIEENVLPERLQQLRLRATVAPIADNPNPSAANPSGYQRRASDRQGPRAAEEGTPAAATSIRMSIERLDKIINSVGELVTAQVRLHAVSGRLADAGLDLCAEEIERLTIILRDASMGLRMQPVGALFSRFNRLVHDLSATLGKEVDLAIEGEETEIDRTVVEKLYDPMVHIIRNSLDHGIETKETRLAAGKPARGTIRLRAYQQGSEVIIQMSDDGAGINSERVLALAIERGLVRPDAQLDFQQILDLIFLPGFSTAATVSDVSGRGVGMDVVKSNVEALRGQVELQTEFGRGSSINLRFPLTMAIIDGLCVEVGGEKYILPLDPVEECLDLTRYEDDGRLIAEINAGKQGLLYNLRGEGVSLYNLATVLCPGSGAGNRVIILKTFRGERIALVVDAIIGRQQVVIKPLGPLHILRKELSGATVLGDGTIALVLDLPSIIRHLTNENAKGRNIVLA